jgi:hypothetical protein
MTRITTDPIGMQPTASIPFGHMTDLDKRLSVHFRKKLSVLIEQKIIIRWQNFQIKFTIPTDQLVKLTTH